MVAEYAAYRNEDNGSYFIQQFCDSMRKLAHKDHFLDIMTQVTDTNSCPSVMQLLEIFKENSFCFRYLTHICIQFYIQSEV